MRRIKVSGRKFKPNNGYPPEFNDFFKLKIRERDKYECAICHVPEKELSRRLDIHHIDYNKRNTTTPNCISLCRHCHDMIHFECTWKERVQWKYKLWRIAAKREYEQRTTKSIRER